MLIAQQVNFLFYFILFYFYGSIVSRFLSFLRGNYNMFLISQELFLLQTQALCDREMYSAAGLLLARENLKGILRHNVINSLKKLCNSLPKLMHVSLLESKLTRRILTTHSVVIFSKKANQPSLLNYVSISMS